MSTSPYWREAKPQTWRAAGIFGNPWTDLRGSPQKSKYVPLSLLTYLTIKPRTNCCSIRGSPLKCISEVCTIGTTQETLFPGSQSKSKAWSAHVNASVMYKWVFWGHWETKEKGIKVIEAPPSPSPPYFTYKRVGRQVLLGIQGVFVLELMWMFFTTEFWNMEGRPHSSLRYWHRAVKCY